MFSERPHQPNHVIVSLRGAISANNVAGSVNLSFVVTSRAATSAPVENLTAKKAIPFEMSIRLSVVRQPEECSMKQASTYCKVLVNDFAREKSD